MAELLDRPDVVAALDEVGGEGVAEGVAASRLGDPGGAAGRLAGALEHGLVKVMGARSRVFGSM